MKNPLHYQVSEFDCGPTTVLNALSYLFQREDLPAELVRNITVWTATMKKDGPEGTEPHGLP